MTTKTVAIMTKEGGWGASIKVTVADTPEADAAAAAFFKKACAYVPGKPYNSAYVDEEASTGIGPALSDYFFPICEHGLSAHLCAGPGHYPSDNPYE